MTVIDFRERTAQFERIRELAHRVYQRQYLAFKFGAASAAVIDITTDVELVAFKRSPTAIDDLERELQRLAEATAS